MWREKPREVVSRCGGIPVYTAEARILTELTGFQLTRGVLCAMRRRRLPDAASLCAGARRVAVLENVMNPTNVGAIFRSAAALGMDAVLLTPGCSDPLYRRAARVSMGTVFQVPGPFFDRQQCPWPERGMEVLRELGFKTAAMALKKGFGEHRTIRPSWQRSGWRWCWGPRETVWRWRPLQTATIR